MTVLQIRLLGDFSVTLADKPLTDLAHGQIGWLLAYLLLHRHTPQARQKLAYLFWPDSSEDQARSNLRVLLVRLGNALPEKGRFILSRSKAPQWQVEAPYTLDVQNFEEAIARVKQAQPAQNIDHLRQLLEEAVDLYTGDLLPTCFEDWVVPIRERLSAHYRTHLQQLIDVCERQRDIVAAIRTTERLVAYRPETEAHYRRLMRLHSIHQDRAAVQRVYRACWQAMRDKVEVEPNEETQTLFAQLMAVNRQTITTQAADPPLFPPALPLINRKAEWLILEAAWQRASKGGAHLVLITGESGIGKTRLAEELYENLLRQGVGAARTRSYLTEDALAYAPVVEWLNAPPLRAALRKLPDVWLAELSLLLPELRVEKPALPLPQVLPEEWQRRRLFEGLARAILSTQQKLLLLVDDLQWCDRTTRDWLAYLLRFAQRAPLLIVATLRSEEVTPEHPLTTWLNELRHNGLVTELALAPLNQVDSSLLGETVAGHAFAPAAHAQLFQASEGNPLFIIEFVRSGSEFADMASTALYPAEQPTAQTSLPPKIRMVLERRLALLSPHARELASAAAVIGRQFSWALLLAYSQQSEEELVRNLDELQQHRLIQERGTTVGDQYDFTHDKLREAAYARLSRAQQRLLHRRVATALEAAHQHALDAVSGQIALHYERAGAVAQAITYYAQAATIAQRFSANAEAISHLHRALALLAQLPLTPERNAQELNLRITLGVLLNMARRYGDVEVAQIFEQIHHLSQQIGDPIQRFAALRGVHDLQRGRSNMRAAAVIAQELLTLAQQNGRAELLTIAYHELCMSALYVGEITTCLQMAQEARRLYRPEMHEFLVTLMPWDPLVGVLSNVHAALYTGGYGAQARQMIAEAIALAERLAHPLSQMFALTYAAILASQYEQPDRALQAVARGMAVSQKYAFPHSLALLEKSRAAVLIHAGELAQGISILRQQLFREGELVVEMGTPWFLAKLAEGLNKQGETGEALRVMELNFALVAQIGSSLLEESELHRIWGEISWRQGNLAEAHQRFRQAIAVAQRLGEKLLELRVTVSLCRLLQSQGRHREARTLLTTTYGWFTEGFDMPDLVEARTLLAELVDGAGG